jgi:hypothetical protein
MISKDVYVNPSCVTCVESKKVKSSVVWVAYVDGKQFEIKVPIKEFLDKCNQPVNVMTQQSWAG